MKKIIITIAVIGLLLIIIKQKNMSFRQSFLKVVYPVFMKFSAKGENGKAFTNTAETQPQQSFYDLVAIQNNGYTLHFNQFKGKKVLLVNTASECGYTEQYDDLQKLYAQQNGKLIILGFPANDFKEQEKGNDEEIAKFCKINFGVTFPLMHKSSVVKGSAQSEIFRWLSDKNKNGWNNQQPVWNFSKYLVNENGVLINYFGPAVSPLSEEILKAVNE